MPRLLEKKKINTIFSLKIKEKALFSSGFLDYCVEKSDTLKMKNILFYS